MVFAERPADGPVVGGGVVVGLIDLFLGEAAQGEEEGLVEHGAENDVSHRCGGGLRVVPDRDVGDVVFGHREGGVGVDPQPLPVGGEADLVSGRQGGVESAKHGGVCLHLPWSTTCS